MYKKINYLLTNFIIACGADFYGVARAASLNCFLLLFWYYRYGDCRPLCPLSCELVRLACGGLVTAALCGQV